MIVAQQNDSFIMINQHDHAKVSGLLAENWRDDYFFGVERKLDVIFAIYEHDRGWIDLDKNPLLNKRTQIPFSFIDYPLAPKIAHYKKGIDEVEFKNKYAALLCSLHYGSFLQHSDDQYSQNFYKQEVQRQQTLLKMLNIIGIIQKEKQLQYHLDMLKFCDNLSLYICLNKPGVDKSKEHPFYRNGFSQRFHFANNQRIDAHWKDEETVSLSVSPHAKEVEVLLPYKEVEKKHILEFGLSKAFHNAPHSTRKVKFI
ncbi:DUF3891 family protein [Bacillus dakarensis]|uniref:DUF3891 family protein n=1 Tax=Robertmurraya dakarensis TaxID=1926278 RepID=UPI000980C157|nr:DUF3891 family protein [Bacillus dakarensis]